MGGECRRERERVAISEQGMGAVGGGVTGEREAWEGGEQ